jgi:hypothetical protein
MPVLKTVHMGAISLDKEGMFSVMRPDRHKLMYELNSWFFDYFYANKLDIRNLPPLDDWTHSQEDCLLWSIQFPDEHWTITIRSETLEFK